MVLNYSCHVFVQFFFSFLKVYDAVCNLYEELFLIGDEWRGIEGLMKGIQALQKRVQCK